MQKLLFGNSLHGGDMTEKGKVKYKCTNCCYEWEGSLNVSNSLITICIKCQGMGEITGIGEIVEISMESDLKEKEGKIMSIFSSIYADHANKEKEKWVSKLEVAIARRDWESIERIVSEIKKFIFTE